MKKSQPGGNRRREKSILHSGEPQGITRSRSRSTKVAASLKIRKDNTRRLSISRRREVQEGLGFRIQAIRQARHLSVEILAKLCGMSLYRLQQIERGRSGLQLLTLLRLAQGLETTVADLFVGIA
jgi:DNA-binding transcriptional regulator YiaG